MAGLNMSIGMETRFCVVNGEPGYFHVWEHHSRPLPASPLVGGKPAGVVSKIFGIVEFKDGVRRVDPTEIIFRDETNDFLNSIDEESRRRIVQGPSAKPGSSGQTSDDCCDDILSILTHANAVTCTIAGYEPEICPSDIMMYRIPSGHKVTVDYNKMAKALHDAGYRKDKSK